MDAAEHGSDRRSGACRCGGVRYHIAGPVRDVLYCHCEDCRRITGNFMAAIAAPVAAVTLVEDDTLRWYSAQPLVAYGFCNRCGATLFWKAEDKAETLSIATGSLDDTTGLKIVGVLFDDERADFVSPEPGVETFPGDRSPGGMRPA